MHWLKQLYSRRRRYDDLSVSIQEHLDERIDELVAEGMSREEAAQAARRDFGNVTLLQERSREEWRWPALDSLWQDLKLTFYQLYKAPAFTVTVVLTLALGIGATTAIFSVVDAVLLKPLSYPDPDRIVQFLLTFPQGPVPSASIPDFHLWREQTRAFQDVSAYDFAGAAMNVTGERPEQVRAVHVTADYFRLFGAPMFLGRTFTPEETHPNGGNVVVLSYGLWKHKFAADPKIVGKTISLENGPYTVVGVTGEAFESEPATDLWVPFQFPKNSNDPTHSFKVAGRLKPGISLEQANAQLQLAAAEAKRRYAFADAKLGFAVRPLRDVIVGDVRSSLLVLGGAVGFVLLIACANIANLLLIRATGRRREFAIRSAIGAGRARIVRQLLTESLVLSSIGGVLGVGIGFAGVHGLLLLSPENLPRLGQGGVSLDCRMLAFALSISVCTGILFGLFPALSASRPDLNNTLKDSANQQGAGLQQTRARSAFVIGEIALTVVLLIGAGLLIRSFVALRKVNSGLDPHNTLTLSMSLAGPQFAKTANVSRFVSNARQRINAIPGVEDSAMTCWPPFLQGKLGLPFLAVDRPSGNSSSTGDAEWMNVSPGYFNVFKIPMLRGRGLTEQDDATAPPVVVISEAMAERFWPHQNPIGQQILIGQGLGERFKDVPRQIVGIAGNTRDGDLTRPPDSMMIIPLAQTSDALTAFGMQFSPAYWLVRTRGAPHQVASLVDKQLSEASGGLPVGQIRSMEEVMSRSVARQRFNMLLLTIFAAAALLLAMVGIYGVMSYSIAQRGQEIGVRMALGADRMNIRNLVLRQGIVLAGIGVVLGVSAALGLVRFLAGFLFGVAALDPIAFLSVPLILLGVALLAVWLPARRAMLLDPMRVLRMD